MQTGCAGPHEHDLAGDGRGIEVVLEHGPRGDKSRTVVLAEMQPQAPFRVGRDLELTDPHQADAGMLAERRYGARA